MKREDPPSGVVAEVLSQAAKALGKAHQMGMSIATQGRQSVLMESTVTVREGARLRHAKVRGDANVSMTATGGTIGTPLFMSPEQLLSAKHVDHRADQWSLAVVAYYALTKRVPFPGETVGAISVAVHAGEFAPPSTHPTSARSGRGSAACFDAIRSSGSPP